MITEISLPDVHRRLWELTLTKQALYRQRARQIAEVGLAQGPLAFIKDDPDEFCAMIQAIEEEERQLWGLKRRLLSELHTSKDWSWLSPVINVSEPSSVPLFMSDRNETISL